ncbi:hypothetical protein CEP53_009912 [Fusarium sp. AF-6]|nr:hypothetical protein CEP53_009912 [Fusarium sp. AF-6]
MARRALLNSLSDGRKQYAVIDGHAADPLLPLPAKLAANQGSKTYTFGEFTDKAAATEWYGDLARDPALEEGLAEPVRRCIKASFSTYAAMEDKEFLRDVLETVVEPLEEFIDQWDGV